MASKRRFSAEWNRLTDHERIVIESHQANLPVKVGAIASALGIEVKVATLDIGISGEIFPIYPGSSSFKIRINKHEVRPRQRFTLAHEIAHFLLHRSMIGDGISDNILFRSKLSNELEVEANRLAADILMPIDAVRAWQEANNEMSKRDSVAPLAVLFDVSEDAMAIRLGIK